MRQFGKVAGSGVRQMPLLRGRGWRPCQSRPDARQYLSGSARMVRGIMGLGSQTSGVFLRFSGQRVETAEFQTLDLQIDIRGIWGIDKLKLIIRCWIFFQEDFKNAGDESVAKRFAPPFVPRL